MANGTQNDNAVPDWAKGATVGAPLTKAVSATDANAPDWAKGAQIGSPVTQSVSQKSTFPEPVENSLIAANNFAQGAVAIPKELLKTVTAPPTTPTEQLLHAVSPGGLPIYRLARNIIAAAERTKLAGPAEYAQAVQDYQNAVHQFRDHDWRNAIPSAVDTVTDAARGMNPVLTTVDPDNLARQISEGTRPGHNLAGPLTTAGMTAALAVAPEFAEGGAFAPAAKAAAPAAAAPAAQAASKLRANPFRAMAQGEKAAQPIAQRIVGEAADTAAGAANVPVASRADGVRQLVDQPIADVAARERATYDTLNKASETDLKDLYDKRSDLQDALDDPTRTDNEALERKLEDINAKISTGEARAKANGVSPKTLDQAIADSRRRFDLEAFKKQFLDNDQIVKGDISKGAPEFIDTQKAIEKAQALNRPTKYAPEGRLTRLLGDQGAKNFITNLYAANRAGEVAINWNKFAKWVLPAIGGGAATVYELAH